MQVYGPEGLALAEDEVEAGSEKMWDLIGDAFKHSNEDCGSIAPGLSLKDFFREKLTTQGVSPEERRLVMLLGEMWGSFIGDPWDRQSLRWFWLEECLDGGKL
jgi:hypothetical protein